MTKRLFDLAFSLIGLLLSSPLFMLIALALKLSSPGPVFYRGVRVGRFGRPFRIFKFRTMVVSADKLGASSTAADDTRLTNIGKRLRRCKLDELPQLINVVKGDMSLVGPRPQVCWAVELYNQEERRLLNVRPGITDYASIKFRNEGEILQGSVDPDREYLKRIAPEKVRLGLEYLSHNSIWIDLKIIFATVWGLVGGDPEAVLGVPENRGQHVAAI